MTKCFLIHNFAIFIFITHHLLQGCIFRLTCSYPELTEDHVLTSAYVKIFRTVTRNAVNKCVWRKKDCFWPPLNKYAMNIWLSSLKIRAHLSWRTGKHLHVLHVLRTWVSDKGSQNLASGPIKRITWPLFNYATITITIRRHLCLYISFIEVIKEGCNHGAIHQKWCCGYYLELYAIKLLNIFKICVLRDTAEAIKAIPCNMVRYNTITYHTISYDTTWKP